MCKQVKIEINLKSLEGPLSAADGKLFLDINKKIQMDFFGLLLSPQINFWGKKAQAQTK